MHGILSIRFHLEIKLRMVWENMRWFQALSDWRTSMYEKKIAKMEQQGRCPDCRGFGYIPSMISEMNYMGSLDPYECPGCQGSGQFEQWKESQEMRS